MRARFGNTLVTRLDQALGRKGEALSALAYNPVYLSRLEFSEPVSTPEAIKDAAALLTRHLTVQLDEQGRGARNFTLTLFDTDGGSTDISVALAQASGEQTHILRLIQERLAALEGRFHEALAFDGATLRASRIEILTRRQTDLLKEEESSDGGQALGQLFNRLTARLGWDAVRRFISKESHIPERTSISKPVLQGTDQQQTPRDAARRPFLLLPRPEPITVMAELPDHPPRRFTWRRKSYRVAKAEGPERIATEWWRKGEGRIPPRDYYIVEDEAGHRFWVYREGFYDSADDTPRWFLHGLFP